MTPTLNISFPSQDFIQNRFLQYIQTAPIDPWSKDLILTYSNQLTPILQYPPVECFSIQNAHDSDHWEALCLCAAYSMLFFSLYLRSTPKNQNLYGLSRTLMVECQRVCGSMFYLEHGFWKTFYQRMAWQNDLHQKPAPPIDNIADSPPARSNLSIFLLPMDALGLSGHLSSFQYEMLEQSLMAMFKGFYNLEQKEIKYQKKSFREELQKQVEQAKQVEKIVQRIVLSAFQKISMK